MIVDSSAILAILRAEPEAWALTEALDTADLVLIAAPTRTEVLISAHRRSGPGAVAEARVLLDAAGTVDVPFDRRLAEAAFAVHLLYGKGNHPARLNFGDCFTYAVAKQTGEPILCVGNDFAQTDIDVVPLG